MTPSPLTASVAMCTYNGAAFLREQIDSILTQTRLPSEIVIRDDRSNDDTLRIIAHIAESSAVPIRVVVNERQLGSTRNFLATIADCRGDIVFLSDQDDVWVPHKVAAMMAVFEAEPDIGLIISDATAVDQELKPLGYTVLDSLPLTQAARATINRGHGTHLALKQPFGTGSSMAMRASLTPPLLTLVRPESLIHDSWLLMVAAAYADIRIMDEPLNLYRQHAGQQVGAPPKWRANTATLPSQAANDSHKRQLETYCLLRDSLLANGRFPPRSSFAAAIESAIVHARRRLSLPKARLRRLPTITNEWASGRYSRFSSGWKSAAKDLLSG